MSKSEVKAELRKRLSRMERMSDRKIAERVRAWVTDYLVQMLEQGYVSHHTKDVAGETMICVALGDDVFEFLSQLGEA